MNFNFKKNKLKRAPKSSEKLVPYKELSKYGILRNEKNYFSKMYKIEKMQIDDTLNDLLNKVNYHYRYQILIDVYGDKVDFYLNEIKKAKNMKEAYLKFSVSEKELKSKLKIYGIEIRNFNLEERIKFYHNFYRYKEDEKFEFYDKLLKKNCKEVKKVIAPYFLNFEKKYFEMSNVYGKVAAIKNVYMGEGKILEQMSKIKNERILLSIEFKSINIEKSLEVVNENISNDFKTQLFIPYELRNSIEAVKEKLQNVINNKEKLFLIKGTVINLSDDLDELEDNYKNIKGMLEFEGYTLYELLYNQKNGLNYTLSVGNNKLDITETLSTNELTKLIGNLK